MYIYLFDRSNKRDLGGSRYQWLPVRFSGEEMRIEWQYELDLSNFG